MNSAIPSLGPSASEIIQKNVQVVTNIHAETEGKRTRGEWLADLLARAVGSWPFIIYQTVSVVAWLTLNFIIAVRHFDPYPYALLNLVLALQNAYWLPIIMMSQNRQAKLSDQRNHLALQLALLAEQEGTQTLRLVRRICEQLKIPVERDLRGLEEHTDPAELHREINAPTGVETTPPPPESRAVRG